MAHAFLLPHLKNMHKLNTYTHRLAKTPHEQFLSKVYVEDLDDPMQAAIIQSACIYHDDHVRQKIALQRADRLLNGIMFQVRKFNVKI